MIEPEQIIYLDNNATTPLDPAVAEEMLPFLTRYYGNPSSIYGFGAQVRDAIELARSRVAGLIGCTPAEIIFTSGGTEANNAALHSALQLNPGRRHLVTTAVEHSSIFRHCGQLADSGYEVTRLGVSREGTLDLHELERAIRPDTVLVTIMWANNETGVIFPVREIAEIVREKRVLFHTDAIQAVGKIPTSVNDSPISSLSLSAHKIYGPKGVGALYVNRRTPFRPTSTGGEHENNRRAGTENVASIVGFGKAAESAHRANGAEIERVQEMRDTFEQEMLARVRGAEVNGDTSNRLPNTSSLRFSGVQGEAALAMLDRHNVCCSTGSACRSASLEPSHVLTAMGLTREQARSSLRFSFSRFTARTDVERAVELIPRVIAQLRELSLPQALRRN